MKNDKLEMINVIFRIPRDRGVSKEKIVRTSVTKAMYEEQTSKPVNKRAGNWQFVELDKPDEEIDLGLDLGEESMKQKTKEQETEGKTEVKPKKTTEVKE